MEPLSLARILRSSSALLRSAVVCDERLKVDLAAAASGMSCVDWLHLLVGSSGGGEEKGGDKEYPAYLTGAGAEVEAATGATLAATN